MRTMACVVFLFIASVGVFGLGVPASADDTELLDVLARQPAGPAFDCRASVLSKIEQTICTHPSLAKRDLALADAYAHEAGNAQDIEGAVADEAAWLHERDRCADVACIAHAYDARTALLAAAARAGDARMAHSAGYPRPFAPAPALIARLAKIAGVKPSCLHVAGHVDLGDGSHSILANLCDPCSPGPSVIFHQEGHTFRSIARIDSCYVSGLFSGFQKRRSHGLFRLSTFSRESCCEHALTFYDYDGRRYVESATLDEVSDGKHASVTFARNH